MIKVKVERFKTADGFGYGIWMIYKDDYLRFVLKPNLNGKPQYVKDEHSISSIEDANKLIESRGELRASKEFQNNLKELVNDNL